MQDRWNSGLATILVAMVLPMVMGVLRALPDLSGDPSQFQSQFTMKPEAGLRGRHRKEKTNPLHWKEDQRLPSKKDQSYTNRPERSMSQTETRS